MQEIELSIEGTGAEEAAQELVTINGLIGHWQLEDDDFEEDGLVTTQATIAGLTGSPVEAAEAIRAWYIGWKRGKQGKTLKKALMISQEGSPLLLDKISVDRLSYLLKHIDL
ncbi:hypothetical protein CSA56_12430 [candidate division KSB3 bacterium]|uniref:Uncharacterized protein n=1 Tax=candidate division KSB3 bacterium TaxID=2044937 RepID=A0A2G6KD17_9BACT|nr:MAG: hypothetical protein CSA56_12430 [candidate division KSB3 bacterium]